MVNCGIKSMELIFKTEKPIFQSKANFDVKILFDKITQHLDPEIKIMLVSDFIQKGVPHLILVHDLCAN